MEEGRAAVQHAFDELLMAADNLYEAISAGSGRSGSGATTESALAAVTQLIDLLESAVALSVRAATTSAAAKTPSGYPTTGTI